MQAVTAGLSEAIDVASSLSTQSDPASITTDHVGSPDRQLPGASGGKTSPATSCRRDIAVHCLSHKIEFPAGEVALSLRSPNNTASNHRISRVLTVLLQVKIGLLSTKQLNLPTDCGIHAPIATEASPLLVTVVP